MEEFDVVKAEVDTTDPQYQIRFREKPVGALFDPTMFESWLYLAVKDIEHILRSLEKNDPIK